MTAPGFVGAADARVSITGRIVPVPDGEVEQARAEYMAKHADAYWASFGDFTMFRMEVRVCDHDQISPDGV